MIEDMEYDLFDTRTGNLINAFATIDDALAFVCGAIREVGPDFTTGVFLAKIDEDGIIAEGKALADLALETGVQRAR